MIENMATLIVGLLVSLGTFLGGLAAYRKWGPEARKVQIETVDVSVKIAGDLRDDAWDSFERVRQELTTIKQEQQNDRAEFQQYREDTETLMVELSAVVRSEKALRNTLQEENSFYKNNNRDLRTRVASLELEVARLNAYNVNERNPHE